MAPLSLGGGSVIVSVFVRRLKEGRALAEFIEGWEADEGFGVPTRVFNAQGLDDWRDVISIGFVDIAADQLQKRLAEVAEQEHVRHERIDTVVESTTLRCMYEVRTEHDLTTPPREIALASPESLLAALVGSS
jgi:hypothetical protein